MYPDNETETDNPLLNHVNNFLSIYAAFIIFAGTVGNLLIVLGMSLDTTNKSVSKSLFVLLSLVDTSVLWTAVVRYWVDLAFNKDIRMNNVVMCKTHAFFTMVTTDCAVGVLCILSVERLIAMKFPFQAKSFMNHKKIGMALGLMLILVLAKHLPLFWIFTLSQTENYCGYNETYCPAVYCPHSWIEFATHAVLPYCILLPTNICLYRTIRQSSRRFHHCDSRRHHHGEEELTGRGETASRILVCLSVVHLVLSLPGLIYVELLGNMRIRSDTLTDREAYLLYDGILLLAFTNNAINFFAIVSLSSRFRANLKQFFCCRRPMDQSSLAANSKVMLHRSYSLNATQSAKTSTSTRGRPVYFNTSALQARKITV